MNPLIVTHISHVRQTPRTFFIGRPSPLGNPFPIEYGCTREQAVDRFDTWLLEQILNHNARVIHELERIAVLVQDNTNEPVYLVCFCAPKACHGYVVRRVVLEAISNECNSESDCS